MLWFDPGFREDLDFEGEFGRDIGGEGVLDVPVDVGVIGEVRRVGMEKRVASLVGLRLVFFSLNILDDRRST